MNYYVYINGITHKLVQGFTINEEYNETLDSASIIISDSPQLDINPYDDVFIYSEYCGYFDINKNKMIPSDNKFVFKGYPVDSDLYLQREKPFFYKHFLLYKFVERIIVLGEREEDTRYEYTIELFSETKGLETIQAPNISITQPLNNKISTVNYINRYLELYNKKIKKTPNTISNWDYYSKYNLGDINDNKYFALSEIFPVEINGNTKVFSGVPGGVIAIKGLVGNSYTRLYDITSNKIQQGYPTDFRYFSSGNFAQFSIITSDYISVNIIYSDYNIPTLLDNITDIFASSYTPDFTLNNPSLRQILEKLLITKDCIPVVYDDKIYAMDITLRRGMFDLKKGQINYITGSKSSENYCTDLKRTYNNALTQENSSRFVEFLGFRNSDSSFLKLENLRVETRFPIYKINQMYMCYFKKIKFYESENNYVDKVFLCKQNITPLVKLNSERNVLSEDIESFEDLSLDSPIEDMARYKLATVGYDIGSNYIDGWGTTYSYPTGNFFWQNEMKSYIENLFNYVDVKYPFGIYKFDYLIKRIDTDIESFHFGIYNSVTESMVIPQEDVYKASNPGLDDWVIEEIGDALDEVNLSLHFKHLFFEIDYQGFFNGTVVHSKGLGKDNLTINDNPSSSLSLLEIDGLAQKEKLDRYGNKGIQINARYKDVNDLQSIGSVYEHNKDKDVVIYHREYSINDNVIDCSYSGTKDYVLKDYFTSVYAKHRTYNLMSYAESITRAENQKIYIIISKSRKFSDKNLKVSFNNFDNDFIKYFFSFFYTNTKIDSYNRMDDSEKINYGFFEKNNNYFVTDINMFVSGVSLCLNICMFDNITNGVKIDKIKNYYFAYDTSKTVAGSTQQWLMLVDDTTTGQINNITFGFGHVQSGQNYGFIDEDKVYDFNNFDSEGKYKKIFNLPMIDSDSLPVVKNKITFNKNIYKDNKEKIDMTLQIESIADNDIFVSPWFFKLSSLFSVYKTFYKREVYYFSRLDEKSSDLAYITFDGNIPILCLAVNKEDDNWLDRYPPQYEAVFETDGRFTMSEPRGGGIPVQAFNYFNIIVNNITFVSSDFFEIKCNMFYTATTTPAGTFTDEALTFVSKQRYITMPGVVYDDVRNSFFSETGLNSSKYQFYICPLVDNTVIGTYKDYMWYCYTGEGKSWAEGGWYQQQNLSNGVPDTVDKIESKNLYWVYTSSNYEFKDYMVYDELSTLNPSDFTDLNVWKYPETATNHDIQFTWIDDTTLEIIHPRLDYGSHILCYYLDEKSNKYNFVFGFKPDQDGTTGKTKTYTNLNISLSSFKDLTVYDENTNLPIGEVPNEVEEE